MIRLLLLRNLQYFLPQVTSTLSNDGKITIEFLGGGEQERQTIRCKPDFLCLLVSYESSGLIDSSSKVYETETAVSSARIAQPQHDHPSRQTRRQNSSPSRPQSDRVFRRTVDTPLGLIPSSRDQHAERNQHAGRNSPAAPARGYRPPVSPTPCSMARTSTVGGEVGWGGPPRASKQWNLLGTWIGLIGLHWPHWRGQRGDAIGVLNSWMVWTGSKGP